MDKEEYYSYLTDDSDTKEFKKLPAYMQRCLNLNKGNYNFWGNGQDYMSSRKGQWDSDVELDSIKDMWELDDLNECVNFYFRAEKKVKTCWSCSGSGMSARSETERWNISYRKENLTEEDVAGLYDDGWLKTKPKDLHDFLTNDEYKNFNIDALRIHTILKRRAEREGYECLCPHCQGNGNINIDKEYSLALQLWILHPRKSSSLGVVIHNITEQDLPKVFKLLNCARERFNNKFDKIKEMETWI